MRNAGIVAFAFGTPETILPNRRIAEITEKKARELNALVYTQLDIQVGEGISKEYTEEVPGNPPPTFRIARGAIQWARRHELTELWVVAARPHLWRAKRDVRMALREIGIKDIEIFIPYEVTMSKWSGWFCKESTQERVRTPWAWFKREFIIKMMPFCIYKRVAK